MCEKPLVPTAAEAEELYAIAKKQAKILCVFQNRRWDADYLTVKQIIHGGKVRLPLASRAQAQAQAQVQHG